MVTKVRKRLDLYLPPRIVTANEVAHRLGCSATSLKKRLPILQQQGFPHYDPVLDGYDMQAIEVWLDRRSGIEEGSDPNLAKLERALGLS